MVFRSFFVIFEPEKKVMIIMIGDKSSHEDELVKNLIPRHNKEHIKLQ